MIHFEWPWMGLLLPLPFLVRVLTPPAKKKDFQKIYFPAIYRLKEAFSARFSPSEKTKNLPFILLSLFWIFFVIALMQPENEGAPIQIKNKGYDLMLAVDVSASMQAMDFSKNSQKVSRLDVTKEVVSKFVLGRQGDRLGLITFGENAYLHIPLTLDTVSISRMLQDIVPGMAGNATAIGDAIGLAIRTLRVRPEGSRALILLTDGEDNSSSIPPLEAAKLAKQYGIRIYTIGIGKKGSVPFPNGWGGYQMVRVSIDEELLKEIATLTGGQYFSAPDKRELEQVYKTIDRLEKTESNEKLFFVRVPLYRYPLGLALLCLFLFAGLPCAKAMETP